MDIKEKIEQVVKKLLSDKNLMAKFEKNPASVIEELLGVDLPDELAHRFYRRHGSFRMAALPCTFGCKHFLQLVRDTHMAENI